MEDIGPNELLKIVELKTFETKAKDNIFTVQTKAKTHFEINELSINETNILKNSRDAIQSRLESEVESRIKKVETQAYQQAYDVGLIEGVEKAYQDVSIEVKNRLDDFMQMIESIKFLKGQVVEQYKNEISKMVIDICQTVLVNEIQSNPLALVPIIEDAIRDIDEHVVIVIEVSADDYQFLNSRVNELDFNGQSISFKINDKFEKGECKIFTSEGEIDISIMQRFSKVKELLAVVG